jgi:hypothetical protein
VKFKRVNADDNPDEYWFECPDCEGSGKVMVDLAPDQSRYVDGPTEKELDQLEPNDDGDYELADERGEPLDLMELESDCPGCGGSGVIEGDASDVL